MPQITLSTRLAQKSALVIDNMLINHHECKCCYGNIKSFISDYLSQFIILKKFKENNIPQNDSQIEFRDFKNFDMDAFERDVTVSAKDMTFFERNKFSRSLVHKKRFGLI